MEKEKMIRKIKNIAKKLRSHVINKDNLPTIMITDLIGKVNDKIELYTFLSQTSEIMDLILLRGLARKFKNCNYLEIGTWRGESIVNVEPLCQKCFSISLSDEELKQYGRSEQYISLQRLFSKEKKKIIHFEQNSKNFNFSKLDKKIDLIFIDGDHSYKGVKLDTANIFKIIHDKTIVVWHDIGSSEENVDYEILNAIKDAVPKDKLKNVYRVSNTRCAIYYPYEINSKMLKFPQYPEKTFEVQVNEKKK